jgi:hypothetical protein
VEKSSMVKFSITRVYTRNIVIDTFQGIRKKRKETIIK